MQQYLEQARHNQEFHDCIAANFEGQYYDWRTTVLFYIAIHCLKALASKNKVNLGNSHKDIEYNINSRNDDAVLPIKYNQFQHYMTLYQNSRTARYDGTTKDDKTQKILQLNNLNDSIKSLEIFKKYLSERGVTI